MRMPFSLWRSVGLSEDSFIMMGFLQSPLCSLHPESWEIMLCLNFGCNSSFNFPVTCPEARIKILCVCMEGRVLWGKVSLNFACKVFWVLCASCVSAVALSRTRFGIGENKSNLSASLDIATEVSLLHLLSAMEMCHKSVEVTLSVTAPWIYSCQSYVKVIAVPEQQTEQVVHLIQHSNIYGSRLYTYVEGANIFLTDVG